MFAAADPAADSSQNTMMHAWIRCMYSSITAARPADRAVVAPHAWLQYIQDE